MPKISIDRIKVGDRIRRDMGDIETLSKSIGEFGLLSPIVVNEDYKLIAGARRLEACKLLGWTEVLVLVKKTRDAESEVLMEIRENEDRKSFSKEEKINAGIELERIEKVKAEKRMKSGKSDPEENLPQGSRRALQVRDIVASSLGMSGKQYEHEKYIVEHKDLFPLSDTDTTFEFSDWDGGKVSTNKIYKLLRVELGEIVSVSPKKKSESSVKEVQVVPEDYEQLKEQLKESEDRIRELRTAMLQAPDGYITKGAYLDLKQQFATYKIQHPDIRVGMDVKDRIACLESDLDDANEEIEDLRSQLAAREEELLTAKEETTRAKMSMHPKEAEAFIHSNIIGSLSRIDSMLKNEVGKILEDGELSECTDIVKNKVERVANLMMSLSAQMIRSLDTKDVVDAEVVA